MKLNSFSEAVADYERLTGEEFLWSPDLDLKVLDSNEFMLWKIAERDGLRYFWIDQTYGFIKNFVPFIKDILKRENIKYIVTATTRKPKAHIRKWKMEYVPEYDYIYEDRYYYVLKGEVENLHG